MIQPPEQKTQKGVSPIWILPILALCLCGWLAYHSYQNAGIKITVYFNDASGITPGKTQVMVKGLPIGIVEEVHPDIVNNRVITTIKMDREVEASLVEDTILWIVRAEISGAKIQGLDTLLSGSYIAIQTGSSNVPQHIFNGLSSAPPVPETAPGLHFTLKSKALNSIQKGSGIYYKNIKIGEVQSYTLNEKSIISQSEDVQKNTVIIKCYIKPAFAHLVKPKTIFTNASGVTVSGKITNLKVRMESLSSLLMGGVLMQTPSAAQKDSPVTNNHIFTLYDDIEAANFGLPMTLTLSSGSGITEGVTKVMYRGIEAGIVKSIEFNDDENHSVTAHILLDPRAEMILKEETSFWLVEPQISVGGIKNLTTLLSGPYITFKPGNGEPCSNFKLLRKPLPLEPLRPGRSYTLTTDHPTSINTDAPVVYKNITVGEVIKTKLNPTSRLITSTIYIYQEYLPLISQDTVFWKLSGVNIEASLKGLRMQTTPLSAILKGGITFHTPQTTNQLPTPEKDHTFSLFENYLEAVNKTPYLQQSGTTLTLKATDMTSLSVGTPILFNKVEVGSVQGFSLHEDHILLDCFIKEKYSQHITPSSRFYNISGIEVSGSLSGININTGSLDTIITGGIGVFTVPKNGDDQTTDSTNTYPLYKSLAEAMIADQLLVTVKFPGGGDIKKGTALKYRGIIIGKVQDVEFDIDLQTLVTKIRVDKKMIRLFKRGTLLWLATSEVNLSGVKNLDTVIFGPFINIYPGPGEPSYDFTALKAPPAPSFYIPEGLNIILESKHLGSISLNAPVYYRQVQVGRVTGHRLDSTFQKVLIHINIMPQYVTIIRENTKFWNVSGTRIEGGIFSGITLKTETVEAILKGGIALATPDIEQTGEAVQSDHRFTLHEEVQKEWLDWNPDFTLVDEENVQTLE